MTPITKDRTEIRLSGSGGQGLITAGIILSEAAMRDGSRVVQTQMYGPSARLGACRSEVIIADHPIAYPEVIALDILLCLSQDAFDKYIGEISDETTVLVDSSRVDAGGADVGAKVRYVPITDHADALGNKIVANIMALGLINEMLDLVTVESLEAAVARRVPERFRSLNMRALRAGGELSKALEG